MSKLREWADTRGTDKVSPYMNALQKSCGGTGRI